MAGYALWLGAAGLAALLLPLLRTTVVRASVAFGWGPWVLAAADKVGVILAVLVWLGWVIYLEQRYRKAIAEGWRALLRRVARTAGAVAAVHALVAGATWVVGRL